MLGGSVNLARAVASASAACRPNVFGVFCVGLAGLLALGLLLGLVLEPCLAQRPPHAEGALASILVRAVPRRGDERSVGGFDRDLHGRLRLLELAEALAFRRFDGEERVPKPKQGLLAV